MQLVKLIGRILVFFGFINFFSSNNILAQENSPFSRIALGDIVPLMNNTHRQMGYTSAGMSSSNTLNFNNPAGNADIRYTVLDIGSSIDSRTLISKNSSQKFSNTNALFNYLQLGFNLTPQYDKIAKNKPIVNNWTGFFGIMPQSRINYKLKRNFRLNNIDSIKDIYEGSGGLYRVNLGTAYKTKGLQLGINFGYNFGNKQYSTIRQFLNDTVVYFPARYTEEANFGGATISAGAQYKLKISKFKSVNLGVYGHINNSLNANRNFLKETVSITNSLGQADEYVPIDTIARSFNQKGKVIMPYTVGAGFCYKHSNNQDFDGLSLAFDFEHSSWKDFSYYNEKGLINTNVIRTGIEYSPVGFSNNNNNIKYRDLLIYRFGFNYGNDPYEINNKKRNQFLLTSGIGLPVVSASSFIQTREQAYVNLGIEFGNKTSQNVSFKENLFRITVGVTVRGNWFNRAKYD